MKTSRHARSLPMAHDGLVKFMALREWEIRPGGMFLCVLAAGSSSRESSL
jgi:hypothetical protein